MSAKISNDRMEALGRLSRDAALTKGDLETALHKIGQVCAKSLNIEEVVFWHFSRDGNDLTSIVSHRVGQKIPVKPKRIPVSQIKSHINALQNKPYLVFVNSPGATKTARVAGEFLRGEIKDSLHVPIYINGALGGMLQFNQLKKDRGWSLSDRVFACEAVDVTANIMRDFGIRGVEKFTPNIMDMLDHTFEHILKELDLEHGMIQLDEVPVTRGYSAEIEMEFVNRYRISPDLTHRTIVVPNVNRASGESKGLVNILRGAGIHSFVTAPMIVGSSQVGCIHVASRSEVNWEPEVVKLLEWAARHIARIVEGIWARQDNLTLSGLIQSFHNNARSLNRMMLFDEAVKAIGESAADVLETDTAFIILRNPDNTISCPWIHGLKVNTIHRIIDTEGASVETILRHGKSPVLFPDIHESILPTSLQKHLTEKKLQSTRIFPLVYEDQVMGAVVAFYKQARLFTRNERSILSLFASSAALTLQNAWMYDQIKQGYLGLALALANAEDAREVSIMDSSLKSAKLAEETARMLKMPEDEVQSVHWAALLHDIGKKDIPESILKKSGPLDENEWEMVRLSPQTGEKMLAPVPQLNGVARIIRNFHEHYDGTGYPDRLKENEIPIGSKVLAVTDAYTSMIDRRAYRDSRPPEEALREIQRYSGKYFDPVVVKVFNQVAEKYVS